MRKNHCKIKTVKPYDYFSSWFEYEDIRYWMDSRSNKFPYFKNMSTPFTLHSKSTTTHGKV